MERVEARLRGELEHEHAVVQAATAADAPPADEPPVDKAHDTVDESPPERRRSPRPRSGPLLNDHQRRAIEALACLKADPPDEQPTPRARAP